MKKTIPYFINSKQLLQINRILIALLVIFILPNYAKSQTNDQIISEDIQARKDIVDVIFRKKKDSIFNRSNEKDKKFFFSFTPFSGSSSEPGISVSTINLSFYLGDIQDTKLSNITFYPTTDFSSYFNFKVIPNLWLSKNSWNIPGKIEIARVLQNNYGLGTNTVKDSLFVIDYSLARLYFNLNRAIGKNIFVGLGYNFDYFYDVKDLSDSSSVSQFMNYEIGSSSNTISSGLTLNFLYDNRKNPINALNGFYSNFLLRINSPAIGSDYTWQSLYFDTRKYFSFSKKRHRTLAFWGLYWGTWGDVPYLNLPGTTHDYNYRTGRGYWKTRYRGKQMLYAEAEYRFDLTKSGLWGAVVFTNIQSFMEPELNQFSYIAPSVGTGLRLKFNKYSDSNLTFDVAVGKDSYAWYFNLNEFF
jgi:hypothetical protein